MQPYMVRGTTYGAVFGPGRPPVGKILFLLSSCKLPVAENSRSEGTDVAGGLVLTPLCIRVTTLVIQQ